MSAQWTLPELAAAVSALPAGTSNAAAATTLAAQTTTLTSQTFTVQQAKNIALTSTNLSWARIVQRSKQTANLPPTTPTDTAILCALTIAETDPTTVIDPSNSAAWAAWNAGLAALHAIGDLSADDLLALAALTTVSMPTWMPAPTEHDVAAAVEFTAEGG